MSTIQDLFQQAQLAEAAYANLWNPATNSAITDRELVKSALINEGMSDAQATAFTNRYQVVSQQQKTGFQPHCFWTKLRTNTRMPYVARKVFSPWTCG